MPAFFVIMRLIHLAGRFTLIRILLPTT